MVTIKQARKLLGSEYGSLSEETIYDLIGVMLIFAKIDYCLNNKK